jgi:hypothetical protein
MMDCGEPTFIVSTVQRGSSKQQLMRCCDLFVIVCRVLLESLEFCAVFALK